MKIFIGLFLIGLGDVCHSVAIESATCSVRYYEALTEAISIKQSCETAAFYDCCQIKRFLSTAYSGLYEISASVSGPFSSSKLFTRCDMDSDNGGWTVIQRRVADGTVDFYRKWDDYESGFGDLDGEFWLGLQNIHRLTTRDEVELRIDLQDEGGNNLTWTYQTFRVDGPADKYRLHVGGGVGPPGAFDGMAHHNNRQFSTQDSDNDAYGTNCAQTYHGAWWYGACYDANLNGPHTGSGATRLAWNDGTTYKYHPYAEMKIRSKTCSVNNQC